MILLWMIFAFQAGFSAVLLPGARPGKFRVTRVIGGFEIERVKASFGVQG